MRDVRIPVVLVVDGEPQRFARPFERRGQIVSSARSLAELRATSPEAAPDVLVLGEPNDGGSESLATVRRGDIPGLDPDLPVLVVSNSRSEAVAALGASADAVLVGQTRETELCARAHALVRRFRRTQLTAGPLTLDVASRRATVAGVAVRLTRREFALLAALASTPFTLTKAELARALGPGPDLPGSRAVERHIQRLRSKLGAAGPRLITVWGVGYRLAPGPGPR